MKNIGIVQKEVSERASTLKQISSLMSVKDVVLDDLIKIINSKHTIKRILVDVRKHIIDGNEDDIVSNLYKNKYENTNYKRVIMLIRVLVSGKKMGLPLSSIIESTSNDFIIGRINSILGELDAN